MSIKEALKRRIKSKYVAYRTSEKTLAAKRRKIEKKRQRDEKPHEVFYFHQLDDPYSLLAVRTLKSLVQQYKIDLKIYIVGNPDASVIPEPEKLTAYSLKDTLLIAKKHNFALPASLSHPSFREIQQASSFLVKAIENGTILNVIEEVTNKLWSGVSIADGPFAGAAETEEHVTQASSLRQKMGHYLGTVFCYGGESYWGLDRLHYLEERLIALNAVKKAEASILFPPAEADGANGKSDSASEIDFFVSLRSPYSAISARSVFELGKKAGVPVNIRYVLPMVMRGLPVPREKAFYIVDDAAREAKRKNIPFGHMCDPLGEPTERGLALMPLARQKGVEEAYLLSFLEGVWAEGLDAGTDKGLRQIAGRAGLDWGDVQKALADEGWRSIADANRAELASLGLWGVPSFKVGENAYWGQDRLWAVEEALS